MNPKLKEIIEKEDFNQLLIETAFWNKDFEQYYESSFYNIDWFTGKKEVFEYQMKIYNELGIYIPFCIIAKFVYAAVTEFDCVWCSSNMEIFGTIEQFQEYLIELLEKELNVL